MWDSTPSRILLAIDRDPLPTHLWLVADEARRRGCGVHVVRVVPLGCESLAPPAGALLRTTEVALRRLVGDALPVSTELCHGGVLASLVAESRHACLVALSGDLGDPPGRVARVLAARSAVPTLVLPARHVGRRSGARPLVTVGVEGSETGTRVVRLALGQAARRRATLRVVHLGGDGIVTGGDWSSLVASALETSYDDVLTSRTDVTHEIVVALGDPAAVLLRHAARSELLVVDRGNPAFTWPGRLGATARTALDRAPCPVLVAGPHPARSTAPVPAQRLEVLT